MTGATGFLGGHVCTQLLRATTATLHCLVRGRTESCAEERVRSYLAHLGGTASGFDPRRVVAVHGNLIRPRMGLRAATYARLADSVDAVFHCAATVNLAVGYDQLAPGNVTATQEVVRFASHGRPKALHHVSTLGIFVDARALGYPEVDEATEPTFAMSGRIGYCQTKFDAEVEVRTAAAHGLPTVVYRPGLILGHSLTGRSADTDLWVKLVRAAVAVGFAPSTSAAISAAPVDYMAQAIVALSQRPEATGRVFHPNLPHPVPVETLFALARECGHELTTVDASRWKEELLRQRQHPAVFMALASWEAMSYLVVPAPRYLPPTVGSSRTHAALADPAIPTPPVDAAMFSRVLDGFVRRGLIPPPPGPGHRGSHATARAAGAVSRLEPGRRLRPLGAPGQSPATERRRPAVRDREIRGREA